MKTEILKYLAGAIAGFLIALLFLKGCGKEKIVEVPVVKTEWKTIETNKIVEKPVPVKEYIQSKPKEVIVFRYKPGTIVRVDSIIYRDVDSFAIADYFKVRNYSDSVEVFDSVNVNGVKEYRRLAVVNWAATVGENQLNTINIGPRLFIPLTERTITKTIDNRRRAFLLGINVLGNQQTLLNAFGISGAYQDKKGNQFEAGLWQFKDIGRQYSIGVKQKIFGK